MPDPIIVTENLGKRYGSVDALQALSVRVPQAAVGLLGPNGAGKSTLIKLLLGLEHPSTGQATILGIDIERDPVALRRHVGYMPESDCLPPDVTAADFVSHMAEMSGLPARAARLRAAETLYQCGVDEERYRLLREFSTGMKQRVKLAQTIVHDPDLVFLDEPTNGLDPAGRDDMLALIERIHRQIGITVILSSHLLEDIERVCDFVLMLSDGRLVTAGEIDSLTAGAGALVVQIDGDAERFAERLRAAGLPVHRDGREVFVNRMDDTAFDVIRDAAADLDLPLRSLRVAARTLEEIYIQQIEGRAEIVMEDTGVRPVR